MPSIEPFQVSIPSLPGVWPRVFGVLQSAGQTPENAARICDGLEAECELCGIKITGAEINQIETATPEALKANPKLERLRKQYCARNGCDSHFYRILFRSEAGIDWSAVRNAMTPPGPETLAKKRAAPRFVIRFDARLGLKLALLLVSIVVVFLVHHWIYGGRIPLIHEAHHYKANPVPPR